MDRNVWLKWITGKYGWVVPVAAFLLVLSGTLLVDRERSGRLAAAQGEGKAVAEKRAGALADEISGALNQRIGALTTAKLRFTACGPCNGAFASRGHSPGARAGFTAASSCRSGSDG